MKVKCKCGRVNKIQVEEDEVFQQETRPQSFGAVTCPVCSKRTVMWLTITYRQLPAGTSKGITYLD